MNVAASRRRREGFRDKCTVNHGQGRCQILISPDVWLPETRNDSYIIEMGRQMCRCGRAGSHGIRRVERESGCGEKMDKMGDGKEEMRDGGGMEEGWEERRIDKETGASYEEATFRHSLYGVSPIPSHPISSHHPIAASHSGRRRSNVSRAGKATTTAATKTSRDRQAKQSKQAKQTDPPG
jgi:hypothetical protein